MADDSVTPDLRLQRLKTMVRLNIAFEEACVSTLSEILTRNEADLPAEEVQQLTSQIRHHRVGVMKQRAVLGAAGIDV